MRRVLDYTCEDRKACVLGCGEKRGCSSFAAKWCSIDEKGCLNLGMVMSASNAGTWETGRRMEGSKPARAT